MTRRNLSIQGAKNKSPEIAGTIREAISAIYKGQQKYSNYNGQTNQGPKHISFLLSPILKLMESRLEDEHE